MFGLSLRQIFFLLLLLAALFAGSQYAPVYLKALEFNDFVNSQVKYAATSRKSLESLRTSIYDKAREVEIPITAKDIKIARHGASFDLTIDYSFPIDIRVYKHELTFHVSESGEVFGSDQN